MKNALKIIAAMLLAVLPLPAQTQTDYQLRSLTHIQLPISTNGYGFAGWLIAPDLLEPKPKLLAVGGWLIKKENCWHEIMAGGLYGAEGSIQPALNFRSYSVYPEAKRLDFYTGLMLRPDRGVADSFITFPVSKFRLGLETELTAGLKSGIKSDARLGPRLSFEIPWANRPTIATSVMPGIRGDTVVRAYLLLKF